MRVAVRCASLVAALLAGVQTADAQTLASPGPSSVSTMARPHLDLASAPVFQSKSLKLSTAKATDIAASETASAGSKPAS